MIVITAEEFGIPLDHYSFRRDKSPLASQRNLKNWSTRTLSLLEEDLYLWTKHIAKAIREGTLDPAEWENIAEEIEGIGVSDALALRKLLGRIISTMLRLKHHAGQPMTDLLKALISDDRIALEVIFECSPSLYDKARDRVQKAYERALAWYELENDLPESPPPPPCPFGFDEIIG